MEEEHSKQRAQYVQRPNIVTERRPVWLECPGEELVNKEEGRADHQGLTFLNSKSRG